MTATVQAQPLAHPALTHPAATHSALTRPALGLWTTPRPIVPPPAQVVAAVVMFHDVVEEGEDGLTVLRVSPGRLAREDIALVLGADLARAGEVRVVWDEREEQIVRVIDTGAVEPVGALPGLANRYAEARKRGARRLQLVDGRAQAA